MEPLTWKVSLMFATNYRPKASLLYCLYLSIFDRITAAYV